MTKVILTRHGHVEGISPERPDRCALDRTRHDSGGIPGCADLGGMETASGLYQPDDAVRGHGRQDRQKVWRRRAGSRRFE